MTSLLSMLSVLHVHVFQDQFSFSEGLVESPHPELQFYFVAVVLILRPRAIQHDDSIHVKILQIELKIMMLQIR